MGSDVTLILHGWGGNKPQHWQEILFGELTMGGANVVYPKLPNPGSPDPTVWLPQIRSALAQAGDPANITVVAHSLGAISWLHIAAGATTRLADRVLLVAPPYVIPEIPPLDAPPGVGAFFPPPLNAVGVATAARQTVIVGGDNDDYATFDQMSAYAGRLGVDIYKLEGAGHISPYWGYGPWPWVLDWCLKKAELPPVGNA
jgi:predicted alpha/beta hydrolase family esterase